MNTRKRSSYYEDKVQSIKSFNYSLDYKNLNLRENPQLYRIWRWEQWVLLVEPYKSEILPHRRFKTPELAQISAQTIYNLFLDYIAHNDFVWADMARKFLQMWFTRSRRYANYTWWKKYIDNPQLSNNENEFKIKSQNIRSQRKDALTNPKAISAKIFYTYYVKAKKNKKYLSMKESFKKKYYPQAPKN